MIVYSVDTGEIRETTRRGVSIPVPVTKHFDEKSAAFRFARQIGAGEVRQIEHLDGKHWRITKTWPVPSIPLPIDDAGTDPAARQSPQEPN
jgi:hypothetical protein